MKTRIFNLIILDESGSMELIKQSAMSGFNETIQTIKSAQKKNADQEHYVSLVVFNSDEIRMVYDCVAADEVPELNGEVYRPNCATPLYDAMGNGIGRLSTKVAAEDKVLVTVITDGEENSSEEFNGAKIRQLVEKKKKEGWIFTYMGANQDVDQVSAQISITNVMSFEASSQGTTQMMKEENARRGELYERMSSVGFNPDEENKTFFKK